VIDEHLYIVTYDIADDKRWRRLFKLMHGYGEWLQLSVFQCRLTRARQAELVQRVEAILHHEEDHLLMLDVGPAENVQPRVLSIGKAFAPVERAPVIV
jgi:CRISPR-associated protein Cas2